MSTPEIQQDIPDFAPVPMRRRRRNGWTEAKQRHFIAELARHGMVRLAADAVRMGRASAYRLRERPGAESFAEAWDIAMDMGRGSVIERAMARAREPVVTPVFYGGRQIGRIERPNDALIMATLGAIQAERTREDRRIARKNLENDAALIKGIAFLEMFAEKEHDDMLRREAAMKAARQAEQRAAAASERARPAPSPRQPPVPRIIRFDP